MTVQRHALPTGTVTFLFSDIEGSTSRWESHPEAMQSALRRHDALLRAAIQQHGGYVFKTIGDAFCAVFAVASDAIAAALEAQRALAAEDWSAVGGLRVRMSVHTGNADEREGDYFGPVVNRVARLLAAGHGGQVLVSGVATDLAQGALPSQSALRDLGLHRLKDLAYPEQVYQLTAPDLPLDFPPLRTLDSLPNNLPLQLTSFLGREDEVAAIRSLLERSRLVTLVGSGGIGKTRTSLQVAAELLDRFPDGAWLLELAPLKDATVIESVLASAMGIRGTSAATNDDAILNVLRAKQALLIFDNCEHLVRDAAVAIDRILRNCPHVTILASSREGLSIAGEATFRMPSLTVPASTNGLAAEDALRYGAIALFVERAQAANDGFTLTDDNAPVVGEICRQLDGIALAIELAAPRIKVLSPKALLDRLKERFRLLTGGSRAALPRQQTMRALIDWSYDLLSEPEQRVFRRVAVFAGGWTMESATAVCTDEEIEEWDFLDLLSALVDKSLIVTELGASDQRYRMLESTRQYARERLAQSGEDQRFLRRHAEYFAAFAHELTVRWWLQPLLRTRMRAEEELDNIRAALTWTLIEGNDTALGIVLAGDAHVAFFSLQYTVESLRWVRLAQQRVEPSTPRAARARLSQAQGSTTDLGDLENALAASGDAAAAFEELGEAADLASALEMQTLALCLLGRHAEAKETIARALAILETVEMPLLRAHALRNKSLTLLGDDTAAVRIRLLEEAMAIYRARGDDGRASGVLSWLAEDEFANGSIQSALGHVREVIAILRNTQPRSIAFAGTIANYAAYLLKSGQPLEAFAAAREGLMVARDAGADIHVAYALQHLAGVAAQTGRPEIGAQLLGYSDRRVAELGRPREPTEQILYDLTNATLRDILGAARFEDLFAAGAHLVEERAIAEALVPPEPLRADAI